MATMTLPQTSQIIVTLEDNALVADIKRALKMIRGIASVRTATISDDHTITPAMRRSINKARREYAKGETIKCSTPEEMQRSPMIGTGNGSQSSVFFFLRPPQYDPHQVPFTTFFLEKPVMFGYLP